MRNIDEHLHDLFLEHDIQLTPHQDWLTTDQTYPACRTFVHEPKTLTNSIFVRLDIEVALTNQKRIAESFAELGATADEALTEAFHNFANGCFHVLLSAIWGRHDDAQLTRERWSINGKPWNVYLGGASCKSSAGGEIFFPDDIVQVIQAMVNSRPLSQAPHWIKIYFAHVPNDEVVVEVLWDNEGWDQGEQILRTIAWPNWDTFYSFRMFFMMKPADENAT